MIDATQNSLVWNYFREHLRKGNDLSQIASGEVDRCLGRIFIVSSCGFDDSVFDNIDEGGYFSYEDSVEEVILYIASLLHSQRRSIVFEDCVSKRGDRFLRDIRADRFFIGKKVYFFSNSESLGEEKIKSLISVSTSANSFAAFVFNGSFDDLFRNGSSIDSENLVAMPRFLESIILDAFDGEAFLVWRRQ
tara:strand:+ start:3191 stop:3763 length:573 start_codon:yes stop_codon:yes gene_type:complete